MKPVVLFLVVLVFSAVVVQAAPNQQTLTAFAGWVQQHKLHSKCNLGVFEGQGLGGVARAPIKEGEPIVMIPSSVLISNQRIKTESFLKDFTEWTGIFSLEPTLVWLLVERTNPNSPWKPYLDILPESFPTHPLSWTQEELNEAKGTALPDTTNAIREALKRTYEHLLEKLVTPNPNVFPAGSFTLETVTWAYQVVNSRSWLVKTAGGEYDLVLVPLADMLNHQPGAGAGSLSEDGTFFSINATRDYEAGDQVFDTYGPKSNYELLSAYGFVLPDNPDDFMTLHFSLKPSNLVHSIVEPILNTVDPNYKSIKIRPNKVPVELLRVFRLSVMEFGELELLNEALQGKGVTLKNELRAFRSAIRSLSGMLQTFDTTIAQDNELLASEGLSVNKRNAVVLRKTQKEVITNVILVLGKMWENILLSGELLGGVAI